MFGRLTISLIAVLFAPTFSRCDGIDVNVDPSQSYAVGSAVPIIASTLRPPTPGLPPYDRRAALCRALNEVVVASNFGEALSGEIKTTTPFDVRVGHDTRCRVAQCASPQVDVNELAWLIEHNYRGYLSVDNLEALDAARRPGYALGRAATAGSAATINNHLAFEIKYERTPNNDDQIRVVGVTVRPFSVKPDRDHDAVDDDAIACRNLYRRDPLYVRDVKSGAAKLVWSYSVQWEDVTGGRLTVANRWDEYLRRASPTYLERAMITSVANSVFTAMLLTFCLVYMCRSVLTKISDIRKGEVAIETVLLEGTIKPSRHEWCVTQEKARLRHTAACLMVWEAAAQPPSHPRRFAILVGAGVQLTVSMFAVAFGVGLGFITPAYRGGMITVAAVAYVVSSFFGGGFCSRPLCSFSAPTPSVERHALLNGGDIVAGGGGETPSDANPTHSIPEDGGCDNTVVTVADEGQHGERAGAGRRAVLTAAALSTVSSPLLLLAVCTGICILGKTVSAASVPSIQMVVQNLALVALAALPLSLLAATIVSRSTFSFLHGLQPPREVLSALHEHRTRSATEQGTCEPDPAEPFQTPKPSFWVRPLLLYPLMSIVPFGTAFLPLQFIFAPLRDGHAFYMPPDVSIAFAMMWSGTVAMTSGMAALMVLCNRNHRWWWAAFLAPSGCGAPVVAFCVYFCFTQLQMTSWIGVATYAAYCALFTVGYVVVAGSIGFHAALFVVRLTYGADTLSSLLDSL